MPHIDKYVSFRELPDYAHWKLIVVAHHLQESEKKNTKVKDNIRSIQIKPPYARMLYKNYDLSTKAWIGNNRGKYNFMFYIDDLKKIDTAMEKYYPEKIPILEKLWLRTQEHVVPKFNKEFGMNLQVSHTRKVYIENGVEIYKTMEKSKNKKLHNYWTAFCYLIEYNAPFEKLSLDGAKFMLPLAFGVLLPPPKKLTIKDLDLYENLRDKMADLEEETFMQINAKIRSLGNEIRDIRKKNKKAKGSSKLNRRLREAEQEISKLIQRHDINIPKIVDLWNNPKKYPKYFSEGDFYLPPNYGLTQAEFDTYVLWHNRAFELCLQEQIQGILFRESMQKFTKGLLGILQLRPPETELEPAVEPGIIVKQKPPKPKPGEGTFSWSIDLTHRKISSDKFNWISEIIELANIVKSCDISAEEKREKILNLQKLTDDYLNDKLKNNEVLNTLKIMKKELVYG